MNQASVLEWLRMLGFGVCWCGADGQSRDSTRCCVAQAFYATCNKGIAPGFYIVLQHCKVKQPRHRQPAPVNKLVAERSSGRAATASMEQVLNPCDLQALTSALQPDR